MANSSNIEAQARDPRRIRVTFSEAIDCANYELKRLSIPSVSATIVNVDKITDEIIELITDVELTPGAIYCLTINNSTDVTFKGFTPPKPANRQFNLYSMMPAMNRREDNGDLKLFLSCLQEITDLLLADIDRFTDILDPDLAPECFLDLMLKDLGNPFLFNLEVMDKRRLLNILVPIYREKGTAQGIKNALRFFLGLEIEIFPLAGDTLTLNESLLGDDWVLGPSKMEDALSFEVKVSRILTTEERKRALGLINYMKPASTHFRLIEPPISQIIDDLELGFSELTYNWMVH